MRTPERRYPQHRPMDGTVYSRGSVVSPQSMNQHQYAPQNVRDSAFMRLDRDDARDRRDGF